LLGAVGAVVSAAPPKLYVTCAVQKPHLSATGGGLALLRTALMRYPLVLLAR